MGFYSGDMSSAIWFHWRGWIPTGSIISLTEITGNSEVCVHLVSVNGFNRETATIFFFYHSVPITPNIYLSPVTANTMHLNLL